MTSEDADLEETYWVEVLFQVTPDSEATVGLRQLAILPPPRPEVRTIDADAFLQATSLPRDKNCWFDMAGITETGTLHSSRHGRKFCSNWRRPAARS